MSNSQRSGARHHGTRLATLLALVAALVVSFGWSPQARADVVVNGLKGEYYTVTPGNWNFETLRATVLDGEINHPNLNPTYEDLVGRTTDVGVRWTGQLTVPATGEYTFYAIGDNGFRLWVADQQLIDFWINDWDKEQTSAPITLTAGTPVNFRLDNFQATGGANMFLRWSGPGIAKEIVPVSAFTPPADFELPPATGAVNAAGDTVTLTFGGTLSGTDALADNLRILIDGASVDVASYTVGADGKSLVLRSDTLIQQGTKVRVTYDGAGGLAVDGTALGDFDAPVANDSSYTLRTRWAADVDPNNPLPEYPRPLVERPLWQSLNGTWQFQALSATSATPFNTTLPERVVVPYPIESLLSGIQRHEDHMAYRRTFTVPAGWSVGTAQRLVLHFDAVDQEATVFVNGTQVAHHVGGYSRFSADVTDQLVAGSNELVVRVTDTTTDIVRGKQAKFPSGIFYTPASGIWRTVWMEPVAASHISDLTLTPDLDAGVLKVTAHSATSAAVTVTVSEAGGAVVGTATGTANTAVAVPIANPRLWTPEDPYLYDVKVTLGSDVVTSHAGMRSIALEEIDGFQRIILNGKRTFLLSTLDQGYWPDGIYTAPTDEALAWDIQATKDLGFNTIRKHIKVEPDRWYHHADQIGMLVWQDMPSNGELRNLPEAKRAQFKAEAQQMVADLDSFTSVIGWVPMNEGWGEWNLTETGLLAESFKAWDPTRLVNAHSGMNCCASLGDSGKGDIIDHHAYTGPANPMPDATRAAIDGEHGGFSLSIPGHVWPGGSVNPYGEVASKQALTDAYVANTARLIRPAQSTLSGAVYTQLTDLEGEVNGFYTYDRDIAKMDFAAVKAINEKVIAVGGAAPAVIPEPGPLSGLAHWPLDEGSGTTGADVIGDHALTIRGATWTDETNDEPGKAIKLDGTSGSYAEASVPGLDTTGSYTVSAWARMDQLPPNYGTVASMDGVDGRSAFFLQYGRPINGFAFSFADGPRAVAVGAVDLGRWYHLVGVRDAQAGTIAFYLDGKLAATQASIGSNLGTDVFAVGRGQWDGNKVDFFNGAIDDVKLWDRALTAEEVAKVHSGTPLVVEPTPTPTVTPTTTPTVTPTVSPTVTPTLSPTVRPTTSPTKSPTATVKPTATVAPSSSPTRPTAVDHYSTPGYHVVNGREWYTTCEPYSQTVRCRTDIWSTQVRQVGGKFVSVTGWHFDNLTYLPMMTRAQWGSNPLANTGNYVIGGRQWRTECDTAATGRNGCRSWLWSSFIAAQRQSDGSYRYAWTQGWVFNSMVRFKV